MKETVSSVAIKKEWDIVAARQAGRQISQRLGFGSVDQARITTAISELARNIYLYAKEGEIIFDEVHDLPKVGLKIIAKDKGPGINDLSAAMKDGYSTSGGLGAGLPGVKRLMDEFDMESGDTGTKVTVIKWARP
ncbi:anti-sigma regulatory factor [Alkalibacillus silvisoli]|uniref:Anti-sigma regulatory factor n=1 Tax=Alkalibacillus silvisoli TaxID=392823 RepID=A0ABN0ZMS5_9BACI